MCDSLLGGRLTWTTFQTWQRVALGVALAVFLVGWFALKWRRASDASAASAAEEHARHHHFQLLKQDPRFDWLMRQVASRYAFTFEGVAPPGTYRVIYACVFGGASEALASSDPAARTLAVFLRSANDCRMVSADLASWQLHDHALRWTFQMEDMVPMFARR